ncbi:MAG: BACON domain-containing protein, partial [Bacteroidales bacterium]|nr:BACON domain-containing protein [Bacteroidales bacterium]
ILVLASLAVFSSCMKEEEKTVATAIMTDKQSLEFGIEDELAQTLTVYADAPWTVETPSWITVEPAEGPAGETEVLVTAAANIREALADRPRSAEITFKGVNMYADAAVTAIQLGDKYRDLVEGTLAEAFEQPAETFVGVKDIQVVALTSDGFVVKDNADLSYVTGQQTVEVGDKGSVYAYVSSINGLPSLKNADKVTVTGNSAVEYGAANDITSSLQTYAPEQIEYVTVKGKLTSKKIEAYSEDGSATGSVYVELLNTHSSLNMSQYDGWLVEAKGYVFSKSGDVVYLVPVSIEGIQSLETIYFADDFEWIKWATVDAVGNDDPSTSVTNIWKADWADAFFAEFNKIGYQYLWSTVGDKEFKVGPEQAANPSVGKDGSMYACKNYLKFGQTSYSGALRLPALSSIQGTKNVQIDFDWCWQVTGSNNADIMTVSVETTSGKFEQTGIAMSEPLESSQSTESKSSHLAWQHATVILTEATAQTVLTIRPTYADPDRQNPDRHQNRWYLDNIKVIEYTGSVSVAEPEEANISISMDNSITFDALPTGPASFTFLSDQEATLLAGADWIYFVGPEDAQLESITIPAGTSTEVFVGCKEYTGAEPRTTEITVESGITVQTIPVKQVAQGQHIEPFISLVEGNSKNFPIEGGTYTMTVQSNIEFECASSADWLTVEAVPATRAMVETASYIVTCAANTGKSRTATVSVYNSSKNLEAVLKVTQTGDDAPKVYFEENFDWVAPWADVYGSSDSVGDNDHSGKAPNVYTQKTHLAYDPTTGSGVEGQPAFLEVFAEKGYEDLNAAGQVIYTQKYYLKFGKTNVHTGLKLPANAFEGDTPVDVVISFDWCAHMITKEPFTHDIVKMVVELSGPGACADSGAAISNAYDTKQLDGFMEWQKFSVQLNGVTKDTRISIRPLDMDKTDKQGADYKVQRYHLDNIKISAVE